MWVYGSFFYAILMSVTYPVSFSFSLTLSSIPSFV